MFSGEARGLPKNGAPKRGFPQVGSSFTWKQETKLERLARYRHSGSLQKFVNYDCKKFHRICPWIPKQSGMKVMTSFFFVADAASKKATAFVLGKIYLLL
jgi:hypothetical protein